MSAFASDPHALPPVFSGLFYYPSPSSSSSRRFPQLLPLLSVSIHSTIHDLCASVLVEQTYLNCLTSHAIEAVYVFPLDENSAVVEFEAELDGRKIKGRCEEKKKAKAEYNAAIARNETAMLLEKHTDNEFQCKVGQLQPGSRCKIRLVYVTQLDQQGTANRFNLPLTIAPKYQPPASPLTTAQVDQRTQPNSAVVAGIPSFATDSKDCRITIDARMASRILSIRSPSHAALLQQQLTSPTSAYLQCNLSSVFLDRHFELLIEQELSTAPRAVLEIDPENQSAAIQVAFNPPPIDAGDAVNLACELIFLIDRSGSMAGGSMKSVIETMSVICKSLPLQCKFNFIGFGSNYQSLWPTSQFYSDSSIEQAMTYVKKLDADLGGTEILPPLRSILATEVNWAYPRQVFLLTDGQVSNTDQLVTLMREHSWHSRLFTFGIGDGVDRSLCKRLAEAGNGECEFVTTGSGGDVRAKVMRQLNRALQPSINNVQIDWGQFKPVEKTILGSISDFFTGKSSAPPASISSSFAALAAVSPPYIPNSHPNFSCDGCQQSPIVGPRFHCTVCSNFDLCSSCESKGAHPADHPMLKSHPPPAPVPPPFDPATAVHTGFVCDVCHAKPIIGPRYKCSVCPDWDACNVCEAKQAHPAEHPLIKISKPVPSSAAAPAPAVAPLAPAAPVSSASREAAEDGKFTQCPVRAPPIFPNTRFVIYALNVQLPANLNENNGVHEIIITANTNRPNSSGPMRVLILLNTSNIHNGNIIHRLAARARIKELECTSPRTSRIESIIRSWGLKYNLASSETSFIAVADKDEAALIRELVNEQLGKEKEIEVSRSRGFHFAAINAPQSSSTSSSSTSSNLFGSSAVSLRSSLSSSLSNAAPRSMAFFGGGGGGGGWSAGGLAGFSTFAASAPPSAPGSAAFSFGASPSAQLDRSSDMDDYCCDEDSEAAEEAEDQITCSKSLAVVAKSESKALKSEKRKKSGTSFPSSVSSFKSESACFDQLIDFQSASGLWELNSDLACCVSSIYKNASLTLASLQSTANTVNLSKNIFATLLCIGIFKEKFSNRIDEWRLVVTKAAQAVSKNVSGEWNESDHWQKIKQALNL